jgi:UDP:flavonoid glycosyltransferase YjiC (YdhE family)
MTDYLFAAWDGGGAVPPLLALAASLRERGHDVRILADPVLREEVEAVGAEYRPWTRAPHRIAKGPEHDLFRDWEAHTPFGAFARVRDGLMCGRAADVAATSSRSSTAARPTSSSRRSSSWAPSSPPRRAGSPAPGS